MTHSPHMPQKVQEYHLKNNMSNKYLTKAWGPISPTSTLLHREVMAARSASVHSTMLMV